MASAPSGVSDMARRVTAVRPSSSIIGLRAVPRVHHGHRLDHQLARAAVGWSIWPDADLDDVAGQLVTLASGNRTAIERALSRLHGSRPLPDANDTTDPLQTTAGRAAAALRLALARGDWAW